MNVVNIRMVNIDILKSFVFFSLIPIVIKSKLTINNKARIIVIPIMIFKGV